jgi:hypothetical protein
VQRLIRLIWLGVLLVPLGLSAEDIQLKDGSKITGTLTGINGDAFHVKTAYGDIQVPRSQIVSITFPEKVSSTQGSSESASPLIDESINGTAYTNRTAHFRLALEPGWSIAPELRKPAQDVVAAFKSEDLTLFFMVTPEKFAGTLPTYRVLAETQYRSKFKDYKSISESPAKLDSRSGIRLIFQGTSADTNTAIKFLVYIVPYEGRMVRLSFFTLEPLFDSALPVFEKIAASYHSFANESVASARGIAATE